MSYLQKAAQILTKNSPTILTSVGIVGVFSTAVLAIRSTPRALEILQEYKEENSVDDLSKLDVVRLTWKCYIPSLAVGVVTSSCIIAAHRVSLRRSAALASLYSITEASLKEYQAKVEETIGKKKEKWIRDEISKDHLRDNPVSSNEIFCTGGDVLVYDTLSGRYFMSDIEKIRKIINDANQRLLVSNYITLNELYSDLGLHNIKLGEEIGWDVNEELIDGHFSSQLAENGKPCLVLNFKVRPLAYV